MNIYKKNKCTQNGGHVKEVQEV